VVLNRRTFQYRARVKDDEAIRKRLQELAQQRRRFGSPRLQVLLRREGIIINHKKTERIYREAGLTLAKRRRFRKRTGVQREILQPATRMNERWSMDFVADTLINGRRLKVLTIVDDYTRESPGVEVDTSINGVRVTHVLDRIAVFRGYPKMIVTDNGTEFTGKALDEWAYRHGVQLHFIDPGKPVENCYIESFNGKFRDECLNEHWFIHMQHARDVIEEWRIDYNDVRPHSSLRDLTPSEFARDHHKETVLNST
jgi:putative transposase